MEEHDNIPDNEARQRSVIPRASPSHHYGYLFIGLNLQKIMILRCATPGLSESNPTSGKMSHNGVLVRVEHIHVVRAINNMIQDEAS